LYISSGLTPSRSSTSLLGGFHLVYLRISWGLRSWGA
jgi:hypothetical protein